MRVLPGLLAALVAAVTAAAEPTQPELLEAFERQLKAVHAKAGPSMACVVVSRSDQYPKAATPPDYPGRLGGFDAEAYRRGGPNRAEFARRLDLADFRTVPDHESASGVVLDPSGLVLTNFHAVEGATKVYVHLPGGKGSYADIHAADGRSDLAVLRLLTPPDGLKAVKLGEVRLHELPDSQPTVFSGKLVAVLNFQPVGGFAPDPPGGTVTAVVAVKFPGNLATLAPPQSVYRYAPLLELEGRAVPPVSGAAVLNLDGELVGLTSTVAAVAGGEGGRAYALPADANFRRIVAVLTRGEEVEYGFLGIVYDDGRPDGIGVRSVAPGSPAADAKLLSGDAIVRINGQPTRSYADLLYQIGSTLAGKKATLLVRRLNVPDRTVEVTVAKSRHDSPVIAANRPAPVFGLRVDWGSVLAQFTGAAQAVPHGVVVQEFVPDSPAAAKFKALGDNTRWVVTHVNGVPTPTPAAFYQAARNQAAVRLTVLDAGDRGARPREVTLP